MPYKTRRLLAITLYLITSLVIAEESTTPTKSAQLNPIQVVETFHDNLLQVMQEAKTLGFAGRYKALAAPIDATYDIQSIATIAIGRDWKKMDDAQQARFAALMRDLIISTYASRFSGYNGETFETLANKPVKTRHLVNTRLIKSDGDAVKLDYFLREKDGTWRVFDVIADGVSDLSLKRADYSAIINKSGLEGLSVKLQENIDQYKAEADSENTETVAE